MKIKLLFLLICLLGIVHLASAQKPAGKPKTKTNVNAIRKCHLPADSAITLKMTLDQVKAWADSLPLKVICNDLKKYKLYNFEFTLITMSPFQTLEFGTGNGGIPILARKAINTMQPKDAIILKNATYKDDKGVEQKLPIISFSIKE